MKNRNLKTQNLFIDEMEYKIPVIVFNKRKRKTILITAGIDGDEYAGIKAAYKLINKFKK
jgi:predicted deacylase